MPETPQLPHAQRVAERLAEELERTLDGRAHAPIAVGVHGAPGSGKTTILQSLSEAADRHELPVIRIQPPVAGLDGPLHAVAQCAGALREHGVNGLLDPVFDPTATFQLKVDGAAESVAQVEGAVLLVDVPDSWLTISRSADAQQTAERGLRAVRRIVEAANRRQHAVYVASRRAVPELQVGLRSEELRPEELRPRSTGQAFLESSTWGAHEEDARRVAEALGPSAADLSPLGLRMAVAAAALSGRAESAADASRGGVAELARLLAQMLDPGLRAVWQRLAAARFTLPNKLAESTMSSLSNAERELLQDVILLQELDGWSMHPSLRNLAGRLAGDEHEPWHRSLAVELETASQAPSSKRATIIAWLETLHHRAEAGDVDSLKDAPDVSYWTTLGRSRSRVADWDGAVRAFRRAIELQPEHAYAHEYLGYNLDRQGRELPAAEAAFREAARLEPANPWWNRRYIEALARRGKIEQAEAAWLAALWSVPGAEDADEWLQGNLFAGVARAFLDRGEEEICRRVLDVVRPERRCSELRYLCEAVLHRAQARDLGGAFVPDDIDYRDRWSGPHLDAGIVARDWYPGRVVGTGEDAVTLELAEPPVGEARPLVFRIDLTEDVFRAEASLPKPRAIEPGTFIELHVDQDDVRVIVLHPRRRLRGRAAPLDLLANWPLPDAADSAA